MADRHDQQSRMPEWLEKAWMSRYLERELSGDEIEWFETYLIDKPDLAERLEEDNDLRDAITSFGNALPLVAEAPSGDTRERSKRKRGPPRGLPPLAAALAVGVCVGWFVKLGSGDINAPALDGNPTRLVYETLRGEATPPRIDHADSQSAQVLVEIAMPFDATDIRLDVGTAKNVLLTPSADGFVSFMIPRAQLRSGPKAMLTYTSSTSRRTLALQLNPGGSNGHP